MAATILKNKLYQASVAYLEDEDIEVLNQNDLEQLKIEGLEDLTDLLETTQALVDDKLFKLVTEDGNIAWKIRSVDEAKRYRALTPEQAAVYSHIDDSGHDGLWTKTIKTRTNLHDTLFNAAIKHLAAKNYISAMQSVEHPSRKMWIKSSLTPSERSTGGPWYTDGELDEEFINTIMRFLAHKIIGATFYASKIQALKRPKKNVNGKKTAGMTVEEAKAARAAALGPTHQRAEEEAPAPPSEREAKRLRYESYLPMPSTYRGYPTTDDLTLMVLNSGLTQIVLNAADIQQLLDIMMYDNTITSIMVGDAIGYKAQRSSLLDQDDLGSVLTEAPCGRCPVFDLCQEGGPVGPSNCEYFSEWLEL